jgi:hypothetical protein
LANGWYADNDGTTSSKGDTVEKMFRTAAKERRDGSNIIFVWLGFKLPILAVTPPLSPA